MRIIFVRHGHPNYVNDCLTELGHKHAAAAAERLKDEGIVEIYSSTCGRAYETAEYTAKQYGLPIVKCDFMREISWGSVDNEPLVFDGHPWSAADDMVAKGKSILNPNWAKAEPFVCTTLNQDYTGITIIEFPDTPGALVKPRFEIMNDARHIKELKIVNVYDK